MNEMVDQLNCRRYAVSWNDGPVLSWNGGVTGELRVIGSSFSSRTVLVSEQTAESFAELVFSLRLADLSIESMSRLPSP